MATEKGATEAEKDACDGSKEITLKSSKGKEFRVSEAVARLLSIVARGHDQRRPDSDPSAATGNSSVNTAASENLEKWDRELVDGLGQDALYDLIIAANYLDIQGLLNATGQKVTDMMKCKTTAQF
ncbi:SKP1-like protein 1B [Phragmites australis]|uniref:SKP1-like protein 1B n=1 Tax=Phragmites australis TaxID=29695 RepID=UPI002D778F22|nr:SKP1-like protein 1B [Phragmites australis]